MRNAERAWPCAEVNQVPLLNLLAPVRRIYQQLVLKTGVLAHDLSASICDN